MKKRDISKKHQTRPFNFGALLPTNLIFVKGKRQPGWVVTGGSSGTCQRAGVERAVPGLLFGGGNRPPHAFGLTASML